MKSVRAGFISSTETTLVYKFNIIELTGMGCGTVRCRVAVNGP